ncbi:MAG: VCBS repeat-containing protein [Limnochordia bacterium]|nr:VCBS repeat-containing protein [Limnochordia bacterium]
MSRIIVFFSIVLLVFSGTARGMGVFWQAQDYLMEAILQVERMDLDEDGKDELIILGRNYEARETFIYALTWSGREWLVLWQSPNLFETASPIYMAVGDFRGSGPELLVMTNTKYRIYHWSSKGFEEVWSGANTFPVRLATGLARTEGVDYLIRTRLARTTELTVFDELVLLMWQEPEGFVELSRTGEISHIRALNAADIGGSGQTEVFTETGEAMARGEVQVWQITPQNKFKRLFAGTLSSSPVFAMAGGDFLAKSLLVIGDNAGRINLYGLTGNGLQSEGKQLRVGYGLVSAAVGTFTGNQSNEIAMVRYPAELMLISE